MIEGSSDELYRAFSNIVENALRYTDAGGSVKIDVRATDAIATVVVEDSGIGIPEDSLQQVFNRFYRVDKSRARESGGAGLGLPIAKAIFEAHNAQIAVASNLGVGSKFTITLRTAAGTGFEPIPS